MTRYYMSDGINDLDVMVADEADMDGTFDAVCVDTGDSLRVNGWLIVEIEAIDADEVEG